MVIYVFSVRNMIVRIILDGCFVVLGGIPGKLGHGVCQLLEWVVFGINPRLLALAEFPSGRSNRVLARSILG